MMSAWILTFLLLFGTPQDLRSPQKLWSAKQYSIERPTPLQPGSSRVIHIPNFGFYGDPKCDASGNVFFDVDVSPGYDSGSVLEISADGSRTKVYPPPTTSSEDANRIDFVDFSVAPSGGLYELIESQQGNFVLEIDSDGSLKQKTRLEAPDHVKGRKLAVFDDGTVLFAGFYTRLAPEDRRGRGYVALFHSSGKQLKELSGYPDVNLAKSGTNVPEGALVVGQDGNAYVLAASKVLVISETGHLVRQLMYSKPDPEASALRLDVSGGLVAIDLVTIDQNRQGKDRYLVLDAVTGQMFGYYQPPEETNQQLCFSRTEGFTFRVVENGQMKLISAPTR